VHEQIAARTGQSFAALQKDGLRPTSGGPPAGWTPAHGLWKDPEKMLAMQEANMTYEQVRVIQSLSTCVLTVLGPARFIKAKSNCQHE